MKGIWMRGGRPFIVVGRGLEAPLCLDRPLANCVIICHYDCFHRCLLPPPLCKYRCLARHGCFGGIGQIDTLDPQSNVAERDDVIVKHSPTLAPRPPIAFGL